jgi:hypothetical protein
MKPGLSSSPLRRPALIDRDAQELRAIGELSLPRPKNSSSAKSPSTENEPFGQSSPFAVRLHSPRDLRAFEPRAPTSQHRHRRW